MQSQDGGSQYKLMENQQIAVGRPAGPNDANLRAQRFHEVRKRSLYDSDCAGMEGLASQPKDGTFRKILHERATSTSQKEPSTNR